ncbi:MAG: effector binding domain-containing protein [Fimbriimonadaceae bacterium]
MNVVIREEPARLLVGMQYVGKAEIGEIPALWDEFVPRLAEIPGGGRVFGVSSGLGEIAPGVFSYLAGRELHNLDQIPDGMTSWEFEVGLYGVVQCPSLDEIRPTIGTFYGEWLPASPYKARGHTMEYYPPSFPASPEIELWFAILDSKFE